MIGCWANNRQWSESPFTFPRGFSNSTTEGSATYSCLNGETVTPLTVPTLAPWADRMTDFRDGEVLERLTESFQVPAANWKLAPAPEHSVESLRSGLAGPHGSYSRSVEIYDSLKLMDDCGTELKAVLYCDCAAKPIFNSCSKEFCPTCHNRKAEIHRQDWRRRLKQDRGTRWEFYTLTMPRRFFPWEVREGVDSLHQAFRSLTRSHWWRKSCKSRLGFGVIEPKPKLSMTKLGLIPTFNIHIHFVRSGARMNWDTLRSKWIDRGGGAWIKGEVLARNVKKKSWDKESKKYIHEYSSRRTEAVLKYMSNYMTHDMNSKSEKKWGLASLPMGWAAFVSEELKGKQLYISGGRAWIEAKRKADLIEEHLACDCCGSGIDYFRGADWDLKYAVERNPEPDPGQWRFVNKRPPPPNPNIIMGLVA